MVGQTSQKSDKVKRFTSLATGRLAGASIHPSQKSGREQQGPFLLDCGEFAIVSPLLHARYIPRVRTFIPREGIRTSAVNTHTHAVNTRTRTHTRRYAQRIHAHASHTRLSHAPRLIGYERTAPALGTSYAGSWSAGDTPAHTQRMTGGVIGMGEPRLESLIAQLTKQLPGAQIAEQEGSYTIVTVHGSGTTLEQALEDALKVSEEYAIAGRSVRGLLDAILDDLSSPGMSRKRHDDLLAVLQDASVALNKGILGGVIPWVQVGSLNREILDIERRITTRLNMVAQEMQLREKEARKTTQKITKRHQMDIAITSKWQDTGEERPKLGLIALARSLTPTRQS